ncbi:hypothetical protein J2Z33_003373 [Rubellimicrobium aerolatum]|nr:hypothetical protein [Rubellimicrobium aerolatum]
MREVGPLPVPAAGSAAEWLADRRARLARRLAEVAAEAEACALEEVQLKAGRLRISPLKAATPAEAEGALAPLYAHLPLIRVTDLLAEVDRWTGLAGCFTHLTTGRAHDEPRAVLTAVLADATNVGHARMAEACNLVSQRQLGWLSSWHLREDTYGAALAQLVDAQPRDVARRRLRVRHRVELGRPALPARLARPGDRGHQPAQGIGAGRVISHAPVQPLRPVPLQGDLGERGRGGPRARRAASPRRRPEHRAAP